MKGIYVTLFAALLAAAAPAFAQYGGSKWESATLTSSEPLQGAFGYMRCYYRTLGGYEFSINKQGMCKFSVKINLESGDVQ